MADGKREEAGSSSIFGEEHKENNVEEEVDEFAIDGSFAKFVPPPLVPLQHHLEKDKDDESLRRWKEKLLGCVERDINGQVEPEVTFHSIGIISNDLGENNTPLPLDESQASNVLFSLKEGSQYRFKLAFTVKYNIVSGLTYSNTVWRAGIQVDQSEGMLGTFAPQQQPYVHLLDEEITPSGALARGVYSAKLRFVDDDKKCHMELSYTFEITKRS
ncbi:rho GDP-dissociation inhibitor 1-like [Chenopodium quinoa]|uniref:rho GDP-dissociation inhibitor 1-like n=1 Tax=Chenopodium quinoa TaxID=63459 RepID=UPI000B771CA1|nr:rho GDP-dissociation inhibitor 1-like [Chenopodium quinoa]